MEHSKFKEGTVSFLFRKIKSTGPKRPEVLIRDVLNPKKKSINALNKICS
jgi:hypothetical protein